MTITTDKNRAVPDEDDSPQLGVLLLESATNPRDQAAVRALVEEEHLLARDNVRTALVVKTDGVMACAWQRFANRLYTLGLDDGDRAFFDLVLSIAGPHQTGLARVMELDDRRLGIILRALVQLSGSDTVAVGTRL